jgi:hypothetical protein
MNASTLVDQIADSGGYSVNADGQSPETGYMVSVVGAEVIFPLASVTAAELQHYCDNHPLLPDQFWGAWSDNGLLYLDVSENIASLDCALRIGRERHQIAIWDVCAQDSILC